MNGFNPIDGGYSDIVSVNDDSLGSVESSKFVLNIDSSVFANEIYTLNYINNLFKSLQKICENCQSITNSAKNYFIRNNEISEVTPPEIIDFDFAISTETTIGIADAMQGYQTGSVSIKSGTLNFRSTPSTSGTILASLTNNTPLRIVSQSENSEWLKVQTEDGQEGYVSSKYVTISNPYSETQTSVGESKDYFTQSAQPLFSPKKEESVLTSVETETTSGVVSITSGTLNVRAAPGVDGKIISSLNKGDSVTILGESESDPNWLKILTSDGQEAYVYSEYIDRG